VKAAPLFALARIFFLSSHLPETTQTLLPHRNSPALVPPSRHKLSPSVRKKETESEKKMRCRLALLLPLLLLLLLPGPSEAGLKRQKNDVSRAAKSAVDGVGSKALPRVNGVPEGSVQTKPPGRRRLAQVPLPQPPPLPSQQLAPLNATGVATPVQESQGVGQAMSRGGRHTGHGVGER